LTKRIWCIALLALLTAVSFAQQGSVISEIVVRGNVNVTRDAILAAMRTRVGQPFVQAQLEQDRQTLEELGFFQAVDVRPRLIDDNNVQVQVELVEWPVVKEVRIVGNTVVNSEEILRAISIQPGEIYNLRNVRPSVDAITKLYSDRGYFARVEDIAPIAESPNTVNISIIELTVGSVSYQGATRTRPWLFDRIIKTRAGEPFNMRRWTADLSRLYGTQWFETVRPIEKGPDEEGRLDLIVDVTETRTGQFGIGLQVDPRSSFAGFLRVLDTNFRGTGQSVGINFLQAARGDGPSVDLTYANPFFDDRDTSVRVALYSRLLYRFAGSSFGGGEVPTDINRYTERRTGASVGFGRTMRDTDFLSLSGRYENIRTRGVDLDPTTPGFVQQDGDVGVLSLGFVRNRRDVDIDPARGDWARIELEPGYSNIRQVGGELAGDGLGTNMFARTSLEYRRYFSAQPPRTRDQLDAPRRVLATRARYGAITGQVPFFEQFFAGGSDTIRGYPEDRFWGRQMFLANVEYRHPIQRAFNVVAFVDYGGAWGGYGGVANFTQDERARLHLGYGLGLSFRSPLGPIRLDFGFNDRGGSRTHFLIGTAF
jgi:outer membrane protein insertion porin family